MFVLFKLEVFLSHKIQLSCNKTENQETQTFIYIQKDDIKVTVNDIAENIKNILIMHIFCIVNFKT